MSQQWVPDPGGRHSERLQVDGRWTHRVRDHGVENIDPLPGGAPTPPAGAPWPAPAGPVAPGSSAGPLHGVPAPATATPPPAFTGPAAAATEGPAAMPGGAGPKGGGIRALPTLALSLIAVALVLGAGLGYLFGSSSGGPGANDVVITDGDDLPLSDAADEIADLLGTRRIEASADAGCLVIDMGEYGLVFVPDDHPDPEVCDDMQEDLADGLLDEDDTAKFDTVGSSISDVEAEPAFTEVGESISGAN